MEGEWEGHEERCVNVGFYYSMCSIVGSTIMIEIQFTAYEDSISITDIFKKKFVSEFYLTAATVGLCIVHCEWYKLNRAILNFEGYLCKKDAPYIKSNGFNLSSCFKTKNFLMYK